MSVLPAKTTVSMSALTLWVPSDAVATQAIYSMVMAHRVMVSSVHVC